uniref:G-protein coupled receptors family 3 profile domain-containing protein n=1 Tax=Sus scrofa TaxID=9823 RepID=A0A8D1PFC1_PIG
MKQCVRCAEDQYSNSDQDHCLSKVVTFLACGDPLEVLACTALGLSVLTAGTLGVFLKHRDTPIVKTNNRAPNYIPLVSLILCCLCSFLFLGRPNTATCLLQKMSFGLIFTVAVSTTLAKTITVVLAFKVTTPGGEMWQWLLSGAHNAPIAICSLIQGTFCAVWLGTSSPFMDIDAHSQPAPLIVMCNKGSAMMLYLSLGYWVSLALLSFTLAFLAWSLPDTFSEAKCLTSSMLLFCSVWITFLPLYNSSKGKVTVVVEVFCFLASSAGLLCCIFAPNCCHIFLEQNNAICSNVDGTRDSHAK